MSLRPAYLSPANSGLPPFHSDMCVCMPVPLSSKIGFGMNVTVLPWRCATFLQMYLYHINWSAILTQRLELHVDFALAGRRHFVVMRLDDDPDLPHLVDHLAAQIVVGVGRADGEVAPLEARLVAEVRLLDARRVPRAFRRIDLVVAAVLVLLVADVVEDEELRLGADEAGVGDARSASGTPRPCGRCAAGRACIPSGDRIDDVGDDADRRLREERIEACGVGVGNGQHVGLVDRLPAANRRAVESDAVLEGALVPACRSGNEQCCQVPSMSTNFRSIISALFFLA